MEKCRIIFEQDGKELIFDVTEKDGVITFNPQHELTNITGDQIQFQKLFYRCYHLFYYILKIDKRKKRGIDIAIKEA